MTEELASTPGWVDERLDQVFWALPRSETVDRARQAYAMCLAGRKRPAVPSDTLGAEFSDCRAALHRALQAAGISSGVLDPGLEALEAEIAAGS
jgi:hypothetical protein